MSWSENVKLKFDKINLTHRLFSEGCLDKPINWSFSHFEKSVMPRKVTSKCRIYRKPDLRVR